MMIIARKLRRRETFNASQLAAELEVNRKTIDRDIEFMRDRLGYEIQWHGQGPMDRWGYRGRAPRERIL